MSSEKNMENPSDIETLRPKIEMPEQLNCKLIIQKGSTEVSIRKQFLDSSQSRKTRSIRTRDFNQLKSKEIKTIRSFNEEGTKEKNGENGELDHKVFLEKKNIAIIFRNNIFIESCIFKIVYVVMNQSQNLIYLFLILYCHSNCMCYVNFIIKYGNYLFELND